MEKPNFELKNFLSQVGSTLIPLDQSDLPPFLSDPLLPSAAYDRFGSFSLPSAAIESGISGLALDSADPAVSASRLRTLFSWQGPDCLSRSRRYYFWAEKSQTDPKDSIRETFNLFSDIAEANSDRLDSEFTLNERRVLLAMLDYVRDASLRILSTVQAESLISSRTNSGESAATNLSREVHKKFYQLFLTQHISGRELADLANLCTNLPPIAPVLGLRELDHPEVVAEWGVNLLNVLNGPAYDHIVEFPQGSLGLGFSLNAISEVMSGQPLSLDILDCYSSGYRTESDSLINYLPPSQRQKLTGSETRILLVDDNLVSGGSLLTFKKRFENLLPHAQIDCIATQIYWPGLTAWFSGQYQFVSAEFINEIINQHIADANAMGKSVSEAEVRSYLDSRLFRSFSPDQLQTLTPIDNRNQPHVSPWKEWKANLTPSDFSALGQFGLEDLGHSLNQLYGSHPYSSLYHGALHLLIAQPHSDISFDDLPQYISSL